MAYFTKEQIVDHMLYKFGIYGGWFTEETLSNLDAFDLSDLYGFTLDIQEDLQSLAEIIRESKDSEADNVL